MFVISIGNTKKKLRLTAKIVLVILLLLLLCYLFNQTVLTSADPTTLVTDNVITEEREDTTYPGEPIRVYNSFENYWLEKIAWITNQ